MGIAEATYKQLTHFPQFGFEHISHKRLFSLVQRLILLGCGVSSSFPSGRALFFEDLRLPATFLASFGPSLLGAFFGEVPLLATSRSRSVSPLTIKENAGASYNEQKN